MKLYRYYTTKRDLELLKNHVWFDTDIHDAAYYANNGVVMEYDIDPNKLKPVDDKSLASINEYDSLTFPNQLLIDSFREKGFNAYEYEWPDKMASSFLIFDKSVIPKPKIITNDDIVVKYNSFRRVVNFGESYVFGPKSLQDRWHKIAKIAPSVLKNGNSYDGFVEDDIFFNTSKKEFEEYVRLHFKTLL